MLEFEPAYLKAHRSGLLRRNTEEALKRLSCCTLCPRQCQVDRRRGAEGICRTGRLAELASFHAHFGEEEPLVGDCGSGTLFFARCNLLCLFCQNYEISHEGIGQPVSDEQLAAAMLTLQQQGCHNINFVTPSHVVPQILAALEIAAAHGLIIPLVYNSSGYDRVETLELLDGVFDIYMPDFKFWDSTLARQACQAPDYPEVARRAVLEMHRQVGDLQMNENGLAQRGLILRHLVLPDGLAGTPSIMGFIARQVSPRTYVNLMSQYHPCGRAAEVAGLERPVSAAEYRRALAEAAAEGITRLDRRRSWGRTR